MITKFKIFEAQQEPEIGDYVLCKDDIWVSFDEVLRRTPGKIIDKNVYPDPQFVNTPWTKYYILKNYQIEYDSPEIEKYTTKVFWISGKNIVSFAKDKSQLIVKTQKEAILDNFLSDFEQSLDEVEDSLSMKETNKIYKEFAKKYHLIFTPFKTEADLFNFKRSFNDFTEDLVYDSLSTNPLMVYSIFLKYLNKWFKIKKDEVTKEILFQIDALNYNL